MKTSAVYFGTVEISLHQFVAQVSVHFGMPSSNTHNTDKNMMARYFNMLQPTRRMMFAVYLLEFLDADGSIIRMPRYSTHTPGYTMTGFTVTQRDRGILEFIMETLQEYDYSSSFGSTTNENTNVLRIAFNNNNNIATNFFRPALRELITSGFPLSEKMMMVNYCLENDLFANIQLWAPNSISFIEYVKDVDDDILVVLGE